jgi:hypothetical protein
MIVRSRLDQNCPDMPTLRSAKLFAAIVGVFLLAAGCSEPMPEFGIVRGVVTANGKPLPKVVITFMPDPTKGNNWPINASATTDEQGKYELRYGYKGQAGAGAPVGWHRVTALDTRFSSIPQGARLPPRWFSISYSSPSSTTLRYEVKPGEQTIDLDLK